jgi:hypothetical protein
MKLSNNSRNYIKIVIILFIILTSIYVLYVFHNDYRIMEGLANVKDCSNCTIRPTSANCVPLYDISYTYSQIGTSNKWNLDISNAITDKVFCQWEPKCTFDNITSQNQRNSLTNSNIDQSIYDVRCCSGSPFYDNSNINFNYNAIIDNISNITDCSAITSYFQQNRAGIIELSYNERDLNAATRTCNTLDPSGRLFNKRGMLFSKIEASFNIFSDPKSMPSDIINYVSFSNFRRSLTNMPSGVTVAMLNGYNEAELNAALLTLTQMNDALTAKARTENLQRQLNRSDLTSAQNTSFRSILTRFEDAFKVLGLLQDSRRFDYKLVNNDKIPNLDYTPYSGSALSTTQYLLNAEQFFNCMGEVKNDISSSFTSAQLAEFSNNDYFGTAGRPVSLGGLGEASYNALGTMQTTGYPSNNDLEMELRRLEIVPSSGNAPVSVISSYLNAINSFYDKQIRNLTGPREHSYNQQLVFDNNSLETKQATFFTYSKDTNNVYPCSPSVLGNSTFEYCGPEAYYESPRF